MEELTRSSGWIKFLGIISVIGGIIAMLAQFPIGIISGILAIFSGSFLVSAASALKDAHEYEAGENLR